MVFPNLYLHFCITCRCELAAFLLVLLLQPGFGGMYLLAVYVSAGIHSYIQMQWLV